ncbi:MAG: type II toxin-antitoxin system VapC family toxin [Bryobacteraceae bacterium]
MSVRLLDSNIWIAISKSEPQVVNTLRNFRPSQISTCAIVRAELIYGARKSQRVEENLAGMERLLATFASLPFDDRAADYYGAIRALLERGGTPIGANDLLIAAIALAHDCILVTRNTNEFQRVPGLRLEDWK